MGLKNRFELGEIDPWNFGQYDGQEYQLGVAWLENFQILPQGGLNRRRGYKRLQEIVSAGTVRLVHIVADDQDYVVILVLGQILLYNCASDTLSSRSPSDPYPTSNEGLRSLRYCTRKNVAAFVCGECAPFCITVSGGSIEHKAMTISKEINVIETKPDEFTPVNSHTNYDKDIDDGLISGALHPRVIAYIGNRVWLANTAQHPNKIWVSKRTDNLTEINLSTYNMYATVHEEYLAFSGRNIIGESIIDKLDGNGHLMREYSTWTLRAEAPTKGEAASGSYVDYGIDPTKINRTSYFKDGALVTNADPNLNADCISIAVEGEYTEEAIAQTEAEYTRKMNMFAARKFYYAPPGGLISANCYGLEIFVISMNPKVSVEGGSSVGSSVETAAGASFGFDITIDTVLPWTSWGDWEIGGILAIASIETAITAFAGSGALIIAAAAALSASPGAMGGAALISAVLALDPIRISTWPVLLGMIDTVRNDMRDTCRDNLNLIINLIEEGSISVTPEDINLNLTDSNIHPDYLTNILQYIKTKYTLYSKIQPFVGIYHKVNVEEVATADCGFTFELAGGTGEFINDIEENQDIMILTAKSERMADYTINGENQLVRKISGEGCEFVKSSLTGTALYTMRTGNRSLQKLQWQPAMNAPSMIQTNQRNSDILDGFETQFLYASETYPKKIRLVSKDGKVVGVQLLLGTEAFYRETTHGTILDMQSFKSGQDEHVYVARRDSQGRIWFDVLVDSIGRIGHIFLDSWKRNGNRADYTDDAVLYDDVNDRVYRRDETLPPGTQYYIGYPYMSKMRTLPTVGFGDMRPVRLPRVKARLLDSCMPFINGYPEGDELNPNIITDQQNRRSGIFDVPVPGTNHRDAAYEIYTNYPDSLSILAICEEGV